MVGRPLTRAKRFAVWEDRLWQMFVELSELAPRRPASQQSEGEIDFWAETRRHLEEATIAASEVLLELEQRASHDAGARDEERAERRGLYDLDKEAKNASRATT